MKTENILVTVIVPTYKRELNILKRAVDSILDQTHPLIEIIIIDDNNFNSDYAKCNQKYYASNQDVVYFQNKKNLGGGQSRNQGIKLARGNYITFLDDDDIYLKNKISSQLKYMLENNFELCFTDLKIYNESNKLINYRTYDPIDKKTNEEILKIHLMHHLTGTPTFMFEKESLMKTGGFDDVKMGQEFHLMFKAISANLSIGYLPESQVIAYRHSNGSISQGLNKIEGEIELFNFKKSYFSILSRKEIRYIKFRHTAVLAVAYKRNNQFLNMVYQITILLFVYPIHTLNEIIKQLKTTIKERNNEKSKN